jgi:hypothetical protein
MSSTVAAHVEDVGTAVVEADDVDGLDFVVVDGVVVVDEPACAVVDVELEWDEHPDTAPPMSNAPPMNNAPPVSGARRTAGCRDAITTRTTDGGAAGPRRGRRARARLRS